jgi:hypothetical protein
MAAPSDAEIASIASEYSIPPAILMGVVKSQGYSPTFSMPTATLGAYSLSTTDVQGNPLLALTVAARTIAQAFAQTGSWEQALSTYLTGDPNAANSPTSSVGGQVADILGNAAVNPSFGMGGYTPQSPTAFQSSAQGFTTYLTGQIAQGGVVTQQSVSGWHQAATQAWTGGSSFKPSANMEQVAEDILTAAKLPVTDANVAVITTMAKGENMPGGVFNWLASTTPEPGSGAFNTLTGGGHVQEYTSYSEGIAASAQTILNGNYKSMVRLMQQGADLKTIASDPGVQQNLRTWQGGSSEDVNNLRRENNVPGKEPAQPKPGDTPPDPAKVGEFAAQLQGAGIDPDVFSEHFAELAAQRRRLLGSKRTDVSDYASMQQALAAVGRVVDQAGIMDHLRSQPHPTYPNVTVGAFQDAKGLATLHSINHTQTYPADGEIAHLAGLDNKEVATYYQQKAATTNQLLTGANSTSSPDQQQGKILQMQKSA